MEPKKKKPYQKPVLTKIKLDAKCAVLGFCKTGAIVGGGVPGCTPGAPCDAIGS